jgi:hypothetical protein
LTGETRVNAWDADVTIDVTKGLLLAGAILLQTAPVLAQIYVTGPYAACGSIADDRGRLACYDAARNQQNTPRPAAALPQPQPAQSPSQSSANAFGLPPPAPVRTAAPRSLSVGVASYTINKDHKFVVTLDNGQVWRQFLDDDGRAKFKTDAKNYVVITHVFWNSYDLKLNTMNAVFRVQRMK